MEFLSNTNNITIKDRIIKLIETTDQMTILSPYLIKNKAIDIMLEKNFFSLKIIVNLNCLLNSHKSMDIKILYLMLNKNHEIYSNDRLHSKIYITDKTAIIGSSNFTPSGLEKKHESCIMFSKEYNSKVFRESQEYCDYIISKSEKITKEKLEEIEKIITNPNKSKEIKKAEIDDLFGNKGLLLTIDKAYEESYYYPKNLNDLETNLNFDFVDYGKIENDYQSQFSGRGKITSKIIAFIKENLYEKNKGYQMKTKILGKTPSIHLWYLNHKTELPFQLETYNKFLKSRRLELLHLYRKKYNIQPINGCFSVYFEYLKKKKIINDDFFEIKYNAFNKNYKFQLLKEKIEDIDNFFIKNSKLPSRNARVEIISKKEKGNISKNDELLLRMEGRLRDKLFYLTKKYNENQFDTDQRNYINNYFKKWNWEYSQITQ